jgi:hypothetical protein
MNPTEPRPLTGAELAAFEDELADRAREIARRRAQQLTDDTGEHAPLRPDEPTGEMPALG